MKRLDVGAAVLPHGVVSPASIVFDAGSVVGAGTPTDVGETPGVDTVDRPELTAVPGFVDLQVNGVDGVHLPTADGDGWELVGNRLLAAGVTAFCPAVVSTAEPYP
ncbi:MAG TPA: hypothetical protein VM618_12805, partial [Acidimicrobiia bacterium]|nr:hypothetical protein [Acidimicrobiia bacterium]